MEYKEPGRYSPIIYLLYSWGSLFEVPSRVPLDSCREELRARVLLGLSPRTKLFKRASLREA